MKPLSVPIKDLGGRTLIIKVDTRPIRLRLAVAKPLFALAAWVLGCRVKFA